MYAEYLNCLHIIDSHIPFQSYIKENPIVLEMDIDYLGNGMTYYVFSKNFTIMTTISIFSRFMKLYAFYAQKRVKRRVFK